MSGRNVTRGLLCPVLPAGWPIKYKKAKLDGDSYRQLVDQSILLFERLNCRDYARFDYREDEEGNIKLLEANPNPGWCWDGKLNYMAGFDDISYSELLNMIIKTSLERIKNKLL